MKLSTEVAEINNVTCNYENFVSMATAIYLRRFAGDSIQTLKTGTYVPWAITISDST